MQLILWSIAAIFVAVVNIEAVRAESFELQLPITCGPAANFEANLPEKYGESLMFKSDSKNSAGEDLTHSFWYNPKTSTWTFVVKNITRGVSCVLATGEKIDFSTSGTQT